MHFARVPPGQPGEGPGPGGDGGVGVGGDGWPPQQPERELSTAGQLTLREPVTSASPGYCTP